MKQFLLIVTAVSIIFTACSPTEYEVRREIVIKAPAQLVFEQVNNHKNRDAWSPWEEMDPQMEKTYAGPESGIGAIYKWSGNDSVGTGMLEILKSEPFTHIESKLTFMSPWETETAIEWNFEETDEGTKTEWINKGTLPGYLFWMGSEDMDQWMGPDFEKGLKQLKEVCERKAENMLPMNVLETSVASMNYYFVSRDIPMDQFSEDVFSAGYEEVFSYLGEDAANVKEPVFAIYHEWDEDNNQAVFDIAVAVESDKPGNETVKRGSTYSGKVVMRIFEGPYEETEKIHEELHEYIKAKGYSFSGSPWESYVVGPGDEPNPEKWVTEIYYPVTE